jgi:hypothetical protein
MPRRCVCLYEVLRRGVRGRCDGDPRSPCLSIYGVTTPGRATTVMRMQGFTRYVWPALFQQLGAPYWQVAASTKVSSAQAMFRISTYFLSVARLRKPLGGEGPG